MNKELESKEERREDGNREGGGVGTRGEKEGRKKRIRGIDGNIEKKKGIVKEKRRKRLKNRQMSIDSRLG